MSKNYRRFSPVGEGQKEKRSKHREDPHGIFMLHSDHADILDEQQTLTRQWKAMSEANERIIAELREQLKQVTSPDRAPDFFALVDDRGRPADIFPQADLAEAQRTVLTYRTGKGYRLAKLWGTIG